MKSLVYYNPENLTILMKVSYENENFNHFSENYIEINNEDFEKEIELYEENGIKYRIIEHKKTIFTKYEFRAKFNLNELILIDGYETNTELSIEQKIMMKIFFNTFNACEEINIEDQMLINSIYMLASFNLISMERANEILFS